MSKGVWKVVKYYRKHQRMLRNTIYYPAFNNGAIEGINNKIKLIKRISFGYRNFNNFKARIMMIFSLYKGEKMKDKFINMVSVFLVLLYLKLKGITHTST
ncbi:transposase [Staphylococcus aureus]|nr:transposase [Staphylococcus aureus]